MINRDCYVAVFSRRRSFVVAAATVSLIGSVVSCGLLRSDEYLTGIKWPEPPIVTSGKTNADPPSDAIVLFDGKDLSAWEGGDRWKIEDGAAIVRGGEIQTKQHFGDCQLHIEWSSPVPATGSSQGRGNSGVYFMGRYELQVLDSYENETYFDGQASAIYKQTPPMVNAMRPPGEWNTYDVIWTAPRFKKDGSLESPAYITVLHNGVLTLNHFALLGNTPYDTPPKYEQHGPGPIKLQDHGNPVRYRNIWIREIKPIEGVREREPFMRDDAGRERPVEENAAVEGRITVAGERLQNATIILHPIAGGKKRRGDVEDGKFQLNGLAPGQYIISVKSKDGARDSKIPKRYTARDQSELRLELRSGTNAVDLDLR